MFHAASWGLPWAGAAAGVKFVYSAVNDPAVLCDLMQREGVTHSAGVPTVWLSMFQHLDATGGDLGKLKQAIIGGSAAPRFMIERLMKAGVRVAHAWGMTETSPIGTAGAPTRDWDAAELRRSRSMSRSQAGPHAVRGRTPLRRSRRSAPGYCRATARPRRAAGARAVGDQTLLQGRGRRHGRGRAVVRYRRRRA